MGFDISGTACDMGLGPVTHGEYSGSTLKYWKHLAMSTKVVLEVIFREPRETWGWTLWLMAKCFWKHLSFLAMSTKVVFEVFWKHLSNLVLFDGATNRTLLRTNEPSTIKKCFCQFPFVYTNSFLSILRSPLFFVCVGRRRGG